MIVRHKSFKDVCFECITFDILSDPPRIIGVWINMGYTESWHIQKGSIPSIIYNRDNWEKLRNPEIPCYRYGTWEALDDL